MKPEPEKLFEDNTKLVYAMLWKRYPSVAHDEDIVLEAMIGLWKACLSYKEEKGKFSTYAGACILNSIRMAFRRISHQVPTVSINTPVQDAEGVTLADVIEDPNPILDEGYLALKDFIEELSPKDRALIQGKLEGKTQRRIARELGMNQATCSKHLTRIQVKYERMFNDDGEN